MLCQSLLQIKVLPRGLQTIMNSQITCGGRMKTFSKGYPLPGLNVLEGKREMQLDSQV
jgi:hypothetical protein